MNATHIKILIVAVLLLGGISYLMSSGGSSSTSTSTSTRYLFSDVSSEKIARVELAKGEETAELELQNDVWTVPERGGYPADTNKVRSLMLKLLDLSSSQAVPTTEEGKKKLGLVPDAVQSGSGQVRFLDKEGNELASLLLGEKRMDKAQGSAPAAASGQYVMRGGEDEVYLTGLPVNLNLSPTNWLDTELINVREASVYSVQQFSKEGDQFKEEFSMKKTLGEDGEFSEMKLSQQPAEGEEIQESVVSQVQAGLENGKLADVRKFTDEDAKLGFDRKTVFQLRSGLVYTIETRKQDEKYPAVIKVAFDEELAKELKELHARSLELKKAKAAKDEAAKEKAEKEAKEAEAEKAEKEESAEEEAASGEGVEEVASGDTKDDEAAKQEATEKESGTVDKTEDSVAKPDVLTLSSAEEAAQLMERFGPWLYELPEYQASKFRYSRSALFTKKDASPPEEAGNTAASPPGSAMPKMPNLKPPRPDAAASSPEA